MEPVPPRRVVGPRFRAPVVLGLELVADLRRELDRLDRSFEDDDLVAAL
jgi:hypothetical protein